MWGEEAQTDWRKVKGTPKVLKQDNELVLLWETQIYPEGVVWSRMLKLRKKGISVISEQNLTPRSCSK